MPNIATILRDHVTLKVESIDRIYLNGYVGRLRRAYQLAAFFYFHRKRPLPSPTLLQQMTEQFVSSIRTLAARHSIPIVHFKPGERKDDVAKRRFARFRRSEGVVFIGVAKESARSFRCTPVRRRDGSIRRFHFSRLKPYFKEGRALRTEVVINDPYDVGVRRSLADLPYLRTVARNIDHRLLELQRTSHNRAIAPRTFESIVLPSDTQDGQHVPGLRFGDPRVMAVLASLCLYLPTHNGFSNRLLARTHRGSLRRRT